MAKARAGGKIVVVIGGLVLGVGLGVVFSYEFPEVEASPELALLFAVAGIVLTLCLRALVWLGLRLLGRGSADVAEAEAASPEGSRPRELLHRRLAQVLGRNEGGPLRRLATVLGRSGTKDRDPRRARPISFWKG